MEKQKLNEQLSRIREIMSITLKESKNSLNKNIEVDIEEKKITGINIGKVVADTGDFASLAGRNLAMFKDMEIAIGLQKNPIMIVDKATKVKTQLKTSDEIFNAIKNNSLSSKELGRVEKGFLKSTNTSPELRKSIVEDYVDDPAILTELGKVNGGKTNDIKKYLKSKGYADDSINEIITQLKKNGKIDKGGNFIGGGKPKTTDPNKPDPNLNPGPTPDPKWWDSLKTIGWKKAALAAVAVGGTWILWHWFKQNNIEDKDIPSDPPVDPNNEWAPCLKKLKESGQAKVVKTSSNTLVLRVINTTYPDGVLFFTDGKVLTNDGKRKGTWKCKGGKVQPIDEQSTGNIANDVSKMIGLLDFPVYESDLIQANKLLEKYVNNGQGKEFLQLYNDSGLADASLETSLKYIATYKPGSVQAKNQMYDKLRKIQSGKTGGGGTSTGGGGTSTGDSLDGIEIIWDDNKKKEEIIPIKKDYYKDCPNFPLYLGCKGPLVSELQTCLKMTGVDGKLGPNTMATAESWGKSNNIELKEKFPGGGGRFAVTEENFNKICGGKPVPVPVPIKPEEDPIIPTPVKPEDPEPVKPEDPEEPTNTEHPGQKLYNRLMGEKKLLSRNFLGNRRIVLKDVELTPEEQKLLEDIMFNKYRYSLIRSKEEYKDGDKLVFKSIKEKK